MDPGINDEHFWYFKFNNQLFIWAKIRLKIKFCDPIIGNMGDFGYLRTN